MNANVIVLSLVLATTATAEEWRQFRGPNAAGVAKTAAPVTPAPEENLIWKTAVPPGHSSPIFTSDRIYFTAIEDEKLFTYSLDLESGKVLWTREAPRPRSGRTHRVNNAAAATPVTDGENVYVFFGDFGLLAYNRDGDELWKLPLGPFNNGMGMSSSPILADGKLVLVCDADSGSYMMALDPSNGEIVWKTDRQEYTRSFSTPTVYRPADGPAELIVPGSFQVAGYSLESGKKLWWSGGFCWQPKTSASVIGDTVFVHCWTGGGDSPVSTREQYPSFEEVLAQYDADKNGKITQEEAFLEKMRKNIKPFDIDKNGAVEERDWNYFLNKNKTTNSVMAIRLGGRGDVTLTHVKWVERKSLPNVPSPVVYDGVVYLVKDGGVMSALDAESGKVLKRGRLSNAMGRYFASPVASNGHLYFLDEEGSLTVVKAGPQWEVVHSYAFGEGGNSTPAVVDGRLYIRTHENLYCFGEVQ